MIHVFAYFLSNLFSLIFTGNLATISLYRFYKESYDLSEIFKNESKFERNLDYIDDYTKKRIVNDFINDFFSNEKYGKIKFKNFEERSGEMNTLINIMRNEITKIK